MTPDEHDLVRPPADQDLVRRRQRSRALVMGVLLGALVLLIFAISIAKIQLGMHK